MYTIAICDADSSAVKQLNTEIRKVLVNLKIMHTVYSFANAESLYDTVRRYPEKFNLLFLETDVQPYSGVELAGRLRELGYDYEIVLISKNMDYIEDGYDIEACQYFTKPVGNSQLRRLFFRLSRKMLQRSSQYLLLNHGTIFYKIPYTDVNYIETAHRKIAIHTRDELIEYPCKLSEIEKMLPKTFFTRCHQSFIIQIFAVSHLAMSKAVLKDGTEIPISRSYKDNVQMIFSA